MTITTILPQPRTIFLDANNNPLVGGYVYTYIPNTTTLKTTYQNVAGSISNQNPIILDAQGSCLLYGSGQYTLTVYDANGNLIYTGLSQDIYALIVSGSNTFSGTNYFAGVTTAVTQAAGDDSTKLATTAFVNGTALTLAAGTTAVTQSVNDKSTKIATTSFANPASSLSNPGYVELPCGIIIQWGQSSVTAGTITNVTLPLTFPNGTFNAYATVVVSSSTANMYATAFLSSTSNIQLAINTGSSITVQWIAIGR